MKISKITFYLLTILLFISNTIVSQTLYIPKKPSFIPPVIDSTQTLSEFEKQDLYQKLKKYSDSTSTEILVMLIPTTQGENIARYATDLGQKWEIGQEGKDNGIIFLVAKDDRKITIQAGYGVEHLLTDAMSRRIIEEVITPQFKSNNFYNGIDNGSKAIFQVLKGEFKNDESNEINILPIIIFILIFFIIIILISRNNKGNSRGTGGFSGPDLGDIIILSGMGRGSGGFSGGSSGGSWGGFGGGGSFGGGGASGSW